MLWRGKLLANLGQSFLDKPVFQVRTKLVNQSIQAAWVIPDTVVYVLGILFHKPSGERHGFHH